MLFNVGAWMMVVILLSPVPIYGLAWARANHFYRSRQVPGGQRLSYWIALTTGSVSTFAYLGYWGFRVSEMYRIGLPLLARLAIDRLIHASQLLCIASLVCLLLGQGPHRVLLSAATLW